MKHKRRTSHPFNDAIGLMLNEFPEDFHKIANIPGIFKETSNRYVYTNGKISGIMDFSCIIDPDNKLIHEKTVVNMEHQSTPVDEKKLKQMAKYAIQQIHDENLPQLTVVISNIETEKHLQEYFITPSLSVKPYYIMFSEEDIEKRLSKVKTKIYNNDHLNNEDALNLGIIAVFAPRHKAQEIIEEIVELYIRVSEQLSQRMELILYDTIFQMVDVYSQKEENYVRLINMITNNTSDETKKESRIVRTLKEENKLLKEDYNKSLEENKFLKEDYNKSLEENKFLKEDYNNALERIKDLEQELNLKNNSLNSK